MTQPGGFNFEEIRKLLEQLGLMRQDGDLDLNALMQRMQQMQARGDNPFGFTNADQDPDASWQTTITAAKHATSAAGPDPATLPQERASIVDHERLVQSWLDETTQFVAPAALARCITRSQWLDETSKGWRSIVEPIIEGLAEAMQRSSAGEEIPEGMDLSAMLGPLMHQSATVMYRERLKRELSQVARDTLTGMEIGFCLIDPPAVLVVPANLAQFTQDLDANETDLKLVLLLREAARERLFRQVGWLSPQIIALMAHYAREITIDLDAIASRFTPSEMSKLSLEELGKLGQEVQGSFFRPASTPTQIEILDRLGVLLALVEGWVDHVSARVMDKWMPNAYQLSEVLRRRRAAEGPVRSVLKELIGLDLPPRLMRDAANLWAAVEHARGAEGRDKVWAHPDLVPTASDLADPMAFVANRAEGSSDELDDELRKLLDS